MIKLHNKVIEKTSEAINTYFQPEVFIEYCKECQYYNKIWACPPYEFDIRKLLESYHYAYIIGSKLFINELNENFQELLESNDYNYASNEIYKAARIELDKRLDIIADVYKCECVLYAGRCMVCRQCTREKQQSCIHPGKMHYSLESLGFNVAAVCKDLLGDKMLWAKEGLPQYFILISAVFSRERLDTSIIYNIMEN